MAQSTKSPEVAKSLEVAKSPKVEKKPEVATLSESLLNACAEGLESVCKTQKELEDQFKQSVQSSFNSNKKFVKNLKMKLSPLNKCILTYMKKIWI